jgi:hypothetical protein
MLKTIKKTVNLILKQDVLVLNEESNSLNIDPELWEDYDDILVTCVDDIIYIKSVNINSSHLSPEDATEMLLSICQDSMR